MQIQIPFAIYIYIGQIHNSLYIRTSTEWNKLKNNIVQAPSLESFKGGTHSISTHMYINYHQSQRYAEYCPAGYNFQKVQKVIETNYKSGSRRNVSH